MRQYDIGGAEVFLQPVQLGRAGDRHDPRLLRQQPGQRDLRRRRAFLRRDSSDGIDQALIGGAGLGRKARHDVAEIVGAEGRVGVDGSGQKPLAERAERHESDAQVFEQEQDFGLGLAPPQRILALQGGDGLDGMGAADRGGAGFGQTEGAHLALGNQVAHRTGDVLHRHVGIDAVLVEQVDDVGLQPLQRGLGDGADVLRAAVKPLGGFAVAETEFGGDDDLVADRRQSFADDLFIEARAIGFGRVEKGNAALDGGADQGDGRAAVGGRAVAEAQPHAAEA